MRTVHLRIAIYPLILSIVGAAIPQFNEAVEQKD
jgi:hypothetical protein